MRPKPYFAPPFAPQRANGDATARTLDLPGYRQVRGYTCGYAVALMVLRYFDPTVRGAELYARLGTGREGTRQTALIRELRASGVSARVRYDLDFDVLRSAVDDGKPVIAYHYPAEHWVVLYGYGIIPERVYVADSRAGEPNVQPWDRYGPTLGEFGIVCSSTRGGDQGEGRQLLLPFD